MAEFFPALLSLAQQLVRAPREEAASAGAALFVTLFTHFTQPNKGYQQVRTGGPGGKGRQRGWLAAFVGAGSWCKAAAAEMTGRPRGRRQGREAVWLSMHITWPATQ